MVDECSRLINGIVWLHFGEKEILVLVVNSWSTNASGMEIYVFA